MIDIILNPSMLTTSRKRLVHPDALAILERHRLELKLNVFDSEPFDDEKPVLVFLHGITSSKVVFEEQIHHYQEQYRVITLDLIGHGQSTKINNTPDLTREEKEILGQAFYTFPAIVAQIAQLLQMKNISNAHFVGWSFGGHIAYGIAAEYPELVASIVSVGSPPVRLSIPGLRTGFSDWFVTTLVPKWIEQPASPSLDEAAAIRTIIGAPESDASFITDLIETDPLVMRHVYLNVAEHQEAKYDCTAIDGEYLINSTSIPLCLLVGEEDMGINQELLRSLSGRLKNSDSRVGIIPKAKHVAFQTNPSAYYEMVDDFLDTIAAPKIYLRV